MAYRSNRGEEHFVLGVDLDGVCADYGQVFRELVAREKGMDPSDIAIQSSWNFPESGWPVADEEEYKVLHRRGVMEQHMLATMPAIPGASDALWRLSDAGVHIRIITHRLYVPWGHADVIGDTVRWLQQPRESDGRPLIPYRDLCFMGDKTDVGADLYVDDAPHNIEALRRSRADVICFEQPYNLHVPGLRAKSWAEVESIVLERVRDRGMVQD